MEKDGDIDGIIDAKGLRQMRDTDELAGIVAQIVEEYPQQVADLQSGQTKILGFLVGQIMRATRGKADPRQVNALLKERLGSADAPVRVHMPHVSCQPDPYGQ